MAWSHKGLDGRNETAELVEDYAIKRSLAKLGYQYPVEGLSQFEAEYLSFIHWEFLRLNSKKK